jgi:DNA polymerase-3 subunit delta'
LFFKDIPYKQKEKAFLFKQIKEDRIPHAQIFLGKEGAGALALALAFVSYIVCSNRSETDSCGECANCKQSHKYIYPDIHWSFPFIKASNKNSKDTTSDDYLLTWRETIKTNPFLSISDWQQAIDAKNSKPNINVTECNSIIRKLSLQSYVDGPKILLMWMPEYLGKEGNRLLKLIEEPTPDTLIILVAEHEESILNTILSRCQLIKVLPYKQQEIKDHLVNALSVDHNEAMQIAKLAEGNLNKALHIKQGVQIDYAEQLFDWLRVAYKGDAIEMQKKALEMAGWSKDQQQQFLDYGLHFLREMMFFLLSNQRPNLTDNEFETAQKMKAIIDLKKIEKLSKVMEDGLVNINRNANLKISYMADTICLGDILKNIDASLPKESIFV